MRDFLTHYYRNISETEEMNEAIRDWLSSTGDWRRVCRNDVKRRIARWRKVESQRHAELRRAAEEAKARRMAA